MRFLLLSIILATNAFALTETEYREQLLEKNREIKELKQQIKELENEIAKLKKNKTTVTVIDMDKKKEEAKKEEPAAAKKEAKKIDLPDLDRRSEDKYVFYRDKWRNRKWFNFWKDQIAVKLTVYNGEIFEKSKFDKKIPYAGNWRIPEKQTVFVTGFDIFKIINDREIIIQKYDCLLHVSGLLNCRSKYVTEARFPDCYMVGNGIYCDSEYNNINSLKLTEVIVEEPTDAHVVKWLEDGNTPTVEKTYGSVTRKIELR